MSEELEKNLDATLDEAKATGEDSENMDPVTGAGGAVKKRKADLNKSVDPKADNVEKSVKTPQGSNDTGLKEAFGGLFEGQELSEEFKTKIEAVFEAAVHQKVAAETSALQEKFDADLQEQVATAVDELVEKVDTYLDYVIESWIEENKVAIESNFKVQVAESLFGGIKSLMAEHNLEVSEETVDAVADMEEKLEEQKSKYNDVVEELMSLKEEKQKLELEKAFKEVAEGLTDTQVEKLSVLAESVSFESVTEYATKVSALKDNYFTESVAPAEDATELLEEAVEEAPAKTFVDPAVAAYAASLGRYTK